MPLFLNRARIEELTGTDLDERLIVKAEHISARVQQLLESWAHRKFVPCRVVDERHHFRGRTPFLRWGEPEGNVLVKYGSINETPQIWDTATWYGMGYSLGSNASTVVWITYDVSDAPIKPYKAALEDVILRAVMSTINVPDVVQFGVINSYSVEGLNITFGAGGSGGDRGLGQPTAIDLSNLSGIKRWLVA